MSIFRIIFIGWASKNKYRLIGAIRGIRQTIRYEVRFAFILLVSCKIYVSIRLNNSYSRALIIVNTLIIITLFLILFIELRRSPFDLQEAESELVRGFNTEYRSVLFAYIIIREYSIFMLIARFIFLVLVSNNFFLLLNRVFILGIILFIRGCYPRVRYDLLINFSWKRVLPLVLILFTLYMVLE